MSIRPANFSGTWYPDSASACEREIRSFLSEYPSDAAEEETFVGGVVPHAGWFFSGSIACNVIHRLSRGEAPDVVVVFGMHLHPGSRPCMMTEGAWETPFGELAVAEDLADALADRFRFRIETPERFISDNTIELQLPFVKYFFRSSKVLAIGVPPADQTLDIAYSVVEIAEQLGHRVRVIGSTDLTHYGANYNFAPRGSGAEALDWVCNENDRKFIDALTAMNPAEIIREGLAHQNACCAGAAAAAVAAARKLGAKRARTVAYATSHDKHPGDSFVGYVGMVFG
ncbi:AmmeMemoRadiSam system protein B [Desulfonema ishimotonii]|uniref:AmmeMemoRadiSam system protein B n=1 Tax=Desulfonema ishimotonii TaxID=45657 RepID=A0A401G269_9BACT|nr:AmmeMemoRadiSam system protein B [Desulfonema ishimotonii]GBC63317.1 AmmeMemoRadiSam system protein B [Desulfonema ishimotonii]